MGVGSVGDYLLPYEDCDTFLSTDAGVTWRMIRHDAHKYEFGDSGSIMVVINDEEATDEVRDSTDLGQTWCAHPATLSFCHTDDVCSTGRSTSSASRSKQRC